MRLEMVIRIQNIILHGERWCLFSNEPYEKKSVKTIEDFVLYSNKHFESHLLGNGQGGTSFFLSSPVGMNHSAMGFSLVFQERVPETLGNRCCFCMFLFLFPVSLRINPPPYFLPFFDVTPKKKGPPKNKSFFHVIPRPGGNAGWWCAACAWGSSDCWATPSALCVYVWPL